MDHKAGKGNYTGRYDGEWLLLYYEKFDSRKKAMNKEREWKNFKSKVYLKEFVKTMRT